MKYVLTLICSVFILSAKSQKLQEDKVDDFNGNRSISTKSEAMGKNRNLNMYVLLVCAQKDTGIVLTFIWTTSILTQVDVDTKIIFLFEGGEKIEVLNKTGYEIFSTNESAAVYFILSEEDKQAFKIGLLKKMRIQTKDIYTDFDIKESGKNIIWKCVDFVEKRLIK